MITDPRVERLATLIGAVMRPPPGRSLFAVAMGTLTFVGLSEGIGRVSWPWAVLADLALPPRPACGDAGDDDLFRHCLGQTAGAVALRMPPGIVRRRPEGVAHRIVATSYGANLLLLLKANLDAGAEDQSGALGWLSLLAQVRPAFPDTPTSELFWIIRQPIYLAFALTL